MALEMNDPPAAPPPSPQCTESIGNQTDNLVEQVAKELGFRCYGYVDLPGVERSPIPAKDYAIYGVVKEGSGDTHVAPLHKRNSSNRLRDFGQQAKKLKIAPSAEDCNAPTDESSGMKIYRHQPTGQNAEIEVDSDEDWQEDEDWCDSVMKEVRRAGET
ncbi:hypothetical protein LTR70_010253 [Exophiala xenobiotica]|uniref:Uncharacterized protein n=1 Tax=Lithohypha guttulata TaxID=1690604 RepID=A0ABR0JUH0_9EURO|nr:hypothetical protein LTR24_010266 [Lithohypha guttulata]KAK5309487.1 hypothetical protein LTR70_010253 [Exophiala xenobiotica]